ncbi:MAG: putative Ig domain-containing protein [Chitinispirillaceae bacterium]|nr:putative Ig domain-containing protein [Chitinispirillaceae bacterium]
MKRKFIIYLLITSYGLFGEVIANTLYFQSITGGFGVSSTSQNKLVSSVGEVVAGTSSNKNYTLKVGVFSSKQFVNAFVNEPPLILNKRDTLYPVELEPFSFTISVKDPDNDKIELQFPVLPSYITRNGNTLSWTPVKDQADSFFKVIASDGSLADTHTFYLKTVTFNAHPKITSPLCDTINEGYLYSYTATGTDSENVPLKFYFIRYPSWMGSGTVKAGPTISGIPPEGAGSATFGVVIEDDRWSDTVFVTLIIRSVNNIPIFTSNSYVEAIEDSVFTYNATANDPENEKLDFWYTGLPKNWKWISKVENGIVVGQTLSGTPLDFAEDSFTVHVSDGINEDSMRVKVSVLFKEEPPVIISPTSINALIGKKSYYKAVAKDPEGSPVTFTFAQKPPWCRQQGADTLVIDLSGFSDTATATFLLIAEDNTSLRDSLTVTIKAVTHNAKPVITSADRVYAKEDSFFTYIVTVSDSDDVAWTFSYLYLPSWLSRSARYGTPIPADTLSGIPDGSVAADRIIVIASDGGEEADTLDIAILITTHNDPPRFVSTPKTTVLLGETYEYQLRAIDPENNTITFKLIKGPEGMKINETSGLLTWKPSLLPNDSVEVKVCAIDQYGDSSQLSFFIRILIDNRPQCILDTILSSRREVVIPFVIFDNDSSNVSLSFFYYTSRGWEPIPDSLIKGKFKEISSQKYRDTLRWNTESLIVNRKLTTRIKVIPSDSLNGKEFISNEFIIDNTADVVFSKVFPKADTVVQSSKSRTISVEYSGPRIDSKSITKSSLSIKGSQSGEFNYHIKSLTASSLLLQLESFPAGGERVTVTFGKELKDTTGKNLSEPFSWSWRIAMLGDFDYNDTVGFNDLDEAALYWNLSARGIHSADSIVNIGPATGRVPYLIPTKDDSLFDFEDLSVFLSMWRYFALGRKTDKVAYSFSGNERNSFAKVKVQEVRTSNQTLSDFKNAKSHDRYLSVSLEKVEDHFTNNLVLNINTYGISNIVTARLTLTYDNSTSNVVNIESTPLFEEDGGQAVVLLQPLTNGTDIQMARFSSSRIGTSGDGMLSRIIVSSQEGGKIPSKIGIVYSLVSIDNRNSASGKLLIDVPQASTPIDFRVKDLIAAPNPATIGVKPVDFSIVSPFNEWTMSSRANGVNLFYNIEIPEGFDWAGAPVEIEIVIYNNQTGKIVRQAYEKNLFSKIKTKPSAGVYQYQCYWDCRGDNDIPVPVGIYRAVLRWSNGVKKGSLSTLIGVKLR